MADTHITSVDSLYRSMTLSGGFRILTISATQMVKAAIDSQAIRNEAHARVFAELLCGAVLMRHAMAPEQRLQILLQNKFSGCFTADTHPDGMTRGFAQLPLDVPVEFGEYTLLKVIRDMGDGQLHQGVVDTREDTGVSGSLTNYLLNSEQVRSVLQLGCVFEDNTILYAGGYLVQMLPGADVNELKTITETLENLPPIDSLLSLSHADPLLLLGTLFGELPHKTLAQEDFFFGCNCSESRIMSALATLSQSDVESLIADDDIIGVDCDYCGHHYELDSEQVLSLSTRPSPLK